MGKKKPKYKLRKYLVVVDRGDGSFALAIDITDMTSRTVDKVDRGLDMRVDFDRFFIKTIRRKNPPEVRD